MKALRNRTIDLTLEEGQLYRQQLMQVEGEVSLEEILDQTILGDSFAVMERLPRGFADLVIVDPPYNLAKDFHGSRFHAMSDEAYMAYTEEWIRALLPLMKDKATIYVCCDWMSSPVVGLVLKKYFHVQNRITWQREKGRGAKTNWKNAMEDIWFATRDKSYTFHVEAVMMRRRVMAPYRQNGQPKDWEDTADGPLRTTYPSNFWDDISIPYWSMPENTPHPTQKPEKLLAKLILASSDKGDVVFDPFLGSGSTAVTAAKLGRHFVGIEQNEQYLVWARKRLEMAAGDHRIQGYTDGVFWERNSLSLQKQAEKRRE